MQTLLAYAFAAGAPTDERVRDGWERVQRWYGPRWGGRPRREDCRAGAVGLHLWHAPDDPCRWPAWSTSGGPDGDVAGATATLHVPLGYERLTGSTELDGAPARLVARLRASPADVRLLTPPFVLAALDREQAMLTLVTDGLGLGRLYEVRTAEGRFWSNRPVAALRFAGVAAEADPVGWRRMAACDWAMADATPYRGVTAVPAATQVEVGPRGSSTRSREVVRDLLLRRGRTSPGSLDATAEALTTMASSVARLWPDPPTVGLSGGRDSRLVAAAFLAAGVDVRLTTYRAAAGEVATARRLVALLPGPVEHAVAASVGERPAVRRRGAYARARAWHDVTEGLRPALYLRSNPPRGLLAHRTPLVVGTGGEFGHAPGYPDDVEQLERLPRERRLDAFARALQAKVVLPRGLSGAAVAETAEQIRRVLEHAAAAGVDDAKALDWFYADERLRRWGLVGESSGRVLPLLVPEFLEAAYGLSTAASRAGALHTALIGRLVPAWGGLPYYSPTLAERQAVPRRRLWEEADADLVGSVLDDPADWGDAFDVPRVQAVWRRARAGRAAARDELLLQRVVWRAAFTDHLAAVNGRPVASRAASTPTSAAPAPSVRPSVAARLAVRANDLPLARRLARTAGGRRLRGWLGV